MYPTLHTSREWRALGWWLIHWDITFGTVINLLYSEFFGPEMKWYYFYQIKLKMEAPGTWQLSWAFARPHLLLPQEKTIIIISDALTEAIIELNDNCIEKLWKFQISPYHLAPSRKSPVLHLFNSPGVHGWAKTITLWRHTYENYVPTSSKDAADNEDWFKLSATKGEDIKTIN